MSACPVPRCSACSTKFTPVARPPPAPALLHADDYKDVLRRHDLHSRGDHMRQNRLAAISCRTLGCFDLSRVPLPAAIIAMAMREVCGSIGKTSIWIWALEPCVNNIPRPLNCESYAARRLRHQRHQSCARDPSRAVPLRLHQIVSSTGTLPAPRSLPDPPNLRSSLQRVLGFHLRRCRLAIDQSVVEQLDASMAISARM